MLYIFEDAFESVNWYAAGEGTNETITSEIAGYGTRVITRKWDASAHRNRYYVNVKRARYEIHPDFANKIDMMRAPEVWSELYFRGLAVETVGGHRAIIVATPIWGSSRSQRISIIRDRSDIEAGISESGRSVYHTWLNSKSPDHAEWVNLDPNPEWML